MKDYIIDITAYLNKITAIIKSLNKNEINIACNVLLDAYNRGANIFLFGNGGSAATASHLACDINKGVCFNQDKKFKLHCLTDNIPTLLALANDINYDSIFVEQLKCFLNKDDIVIGYSGSGNSKNVLKAIEYANQREAITLGICGYNGGVLKSLSKYFIHVNINDMQISEDIHFIINHVFMKVLYKEINGTEC